MRQINIVTLFPEFFDSPLKTGLLGRFRARGGISFSFHNPRDFSEDPHRHVDDSPYGGGPGMVMQAPTILRTVRSIADPGRIILLTPAGRQLNSAIAKDLAQSDRLTLVCGRYEGIDERAAQILNMEKISIGDFILNGGETAALALIEAVCRFMPGFLGKEESASDESFSAGLLEYPHYTRPETVEGLETPAVLKSGNHAAIAAWRRKMALARTRAIRPDLLESCDLCQSDADALSEQPLTQPGRNLSLCLMHWPVKLENGRIGASSLTNLDVHDIARIAHSYGLAAFYVLTPLADQLRLLGQILAHWQGGANADRAQALAKVRPVASFQDMRAAAFSAHGAMPVCIAASARWPGKNRPAIAPEKVLELCRTRPVIICLGTARGLADAALAECSAQLRPLRYLGANHLSVRSAAAIIADRILGDLH